MSPLGVEETDSGVCRQLAGCFPETLFPLRASVSRVSLFSAIYKPASITGDGTGFVSRACFFFLFYFYLFFFNFFFSFFLRESKELPYCWSAQQKEAGQEETQRVEQDLQ